MIRLIFATVGCLASVAPDTTVVLASLEFDLTGDGRAEVLEVLGMPQSPDSVEVRLVIRTPERVLSEVPLAPPTKTIGFDAGRRLLSEEEYQERLDRFGTFILNHDRFKTATEFEGWLQRSAPHRVSAIPEVIARDSGGLVDVATGSRLWDAIRQRDGTVFQFSPGGDLVVAIAWSQPHKRFYRLLECC